MPNPSQAYTLIALGTLQSRVDKNSILHQIFDACDGEDKHDLTRATPRHDKCLFKGTDVLDLSGTVEANVQEGVENIRDWLGKYATRNAQGKFVINMGGYSRGALTCLRIANRLYSTLKSLQPVCQNDSNGQPILLDDIEINIFGIDPVAGVGDKSNAEVRDIPPIVKNYTFTLQTHERRQEFTPQDLTRINVLDYKKTKVTALPMFGVHWSTTVKQEDNTNHSSELTLQLMHQFFSDNNSKFKNHNAIPDLVDLQGHTSPATMRNEQQLLELYTEAKKHEQDYFQESKRWEFGHLLVKKRRSFMEHLDDYVADSDFFMNQHHRDLFQKCYPATFKHFFQDDFYSLLSNIEIRNELKKQPRDFVFWLTKANVVIQQEANTAPLRICSADTRYTQGHVELCCPKLWAAMKARLMQVRNELSTMPRDLSSSLPILRLIPDAKPHPLKNINNNPDSAYTLFLQARQALFNYRRIKSDYRFVNEIMAYTKRDETNRTDEIEKQLNKIMSSPSGSEKKKKKILDTLQLHYIALVESDCSSQLCGLLKEILKDNGRNFREVHSGKLAWILSLPGRGIKSIGKIFRFLGQISSFIGGFSGDCVSATGRFFTNRTSFISVPFKYLIGVPLRKLGAAVKRACSFFEDCGDIFRSAGKKLVQVSGRHTVEVIPPPVCRMSSTASGLSRMSNIERPVAAPASRKSEPYSTLRDRAGRLEYKSTLVESHQSSNRNNPVFV